MAKPKTPLSAKDLKRYFDDAHSKADLRSTRVLEVLTDAIKFGRAILQGNASELEVREFFRVIYLVLTEVEDVNRDLAKTGEEFGVEGRLWDCAKDAVKVHSALRNVLSDAHLVLIHHRRHDTSHIAVDSYRLRVNAQGLSEQRFVSTLQRDLTVPEMDALLTAAQTDLKPEMAIAQRSVTLLEALFAISAPLYSPQRFEYEAYPVGDDDGTWAQIAVKLGVSLEGLLRANRNPAPEDRPQPATIILYPTKHR